MQHKLEADSILLDFGTKRVLSDIHIECETGKITGILGRNGEGKTSLMKIIYGNLKASSKSIRFDKEVVVDAYKRPDLLTYLPQFNFIPQHLTLKRVFSDFALDFCECVALFPELSSNFTSPIGKLSGGQRRFVEVYVIIKSDSQFSMLDEPFSHLMPAQIDNILQLLQIEKSKKGFLLTDHMYHYVTTVSDRLYVLAHHKTHLTKNTADIEKFGYARLS